MQNGKYELITQHKILDILRFQVLCFSRTLYTRSTKRRINTFSVEIAKFHRRALKLE